MVIFGFCKDWAVEKCTEPVFKMFRKPRNEQNKSWYFFLKRPVYICDFINGKVGLHALEQLLMIHY